MRRLKRWADRLLTLAFGVCVFCGMGTASSDLFHFVPGAFPFHVSCSDSG